MTGLERAIRDEDSLQIRKLLNKNNLNRPDSEGITPLLSAAIHGRIKSAKVILQRGADVNKADNSGNTPLMFAAKNGNLELLKLLLFFGADSSAKSQRGKTAFDLAEFNNKIECLEFLNLQIKKENIQKISTELKSAVNPPSIKENESKGNYSTQKNNDSKLKFETLGEKSRINIHSKINIQKDEIHNITKSNLSETMNPPSSAMIWKKSTKVI